MVILENVKWGKRSTMTEDQANRLIANYPDAFRIVQESKVKNKASIAIVAESENVPTEE